MLEMVLKVVSCCLSFIFRLTQGIRKLIARIASSVLDVRASLIKSSFAAMQWPYYLLVAVQWNAVCVVF